MARGSRVGGRPGGVPLPLPPKIQDGRAHELPVQNSALVATVTLVDYSAVKLLWYMCLRDSLFTFSCILVA